MEHAESHEAEGGAPGPALKDQELAEGSGGSSGTCLEVDHQDQGKHGLVGRKPDQKGGQNRAVQSHEAAGGGQETDQGV